MNFVHSQKPRLNLEGDEIIKYLEHNRVYGLEYESNKTDFELVWWKNVFLHIKNQVIHPWALTVVFSPNIKNSRKRDYWENTSTFTEYPVSTWSSWSDSPRWALRNFGHVLRQNTLKQTLLMHAVRSVGTVMGSDHDIYPFWITCNGHIKCSYMSWQTIKMTASRWYEIKQIHFFKLKTNT